MAAIIDDGPRIWITDTLNRKLGRVAAVATGTTMLWTVLILHRGPARFALAVGAIILFAQGCRTRPGVDAATVNDLAEVEECVMRLAERVDDHEHGTDRQYATLYCLVCEIRDQLR